MELINVLKTLTPKPVVGYEHSGHILYSDIILACRALGQNNNHYIDVLLKKLADENIIQIVYLKHSGSEDMIAGVILK